MKKQLNTKTNCRLCDGITTKEFDKKILDQYIVQYYRCESCNSLQTELPYWLEEAYKPENERFDTGQVIRSIHNASILNALLNHLQLQSSLIIDYGCGSGLTVRLLRDLGLNAYGYDAYSIPRLAAGFHINELSSADVINLCEVAEHFDEPLKYFDSIFTSNTKLVLMQTELFSNVNPEWNYLTPEHGQHIFFYSAKSIQFISNRYKIAATFLGEYVLFFSPTLIDKLFISGKAIIQPGLQSQLQNAVPHMMMALASNQYKYATFDSNNLLEWSRLQKSAAPKMTQ